MKLGNIEITVEDVKALAAFVSECWKRLVVPKNKPGKVGVIIAVRTETVEQQRRLESDIVRELIKFLNDSQLGAAFCIVQFPNEICSKIHDHNCARQYLARARGHMIIHGEMTNRMHGGSENFVIKLNGVVRHAPVPHEISRQLGREFRELLPGRLHFPAAEEISGFELTERWIGIVIRYIIGIAALISLRLEFAHNVYSDLQSDLERTSAESGTAIPIVEKLKKRVPNRLREVVSNIIIRQYYFFAASRNRQFIEDTKEYLDIMLRLDKDDYMAHNMRAMYHYMQGDVDAALLELENLSGKDPAWRMNRGFLFACKGDIDKALDEYRRAFYLQSQPRSIIDVEVFIGEELDRQPELCQLLFFRGLVNLKAKHDYALAKEDFESYLKAKDSKSFPELVELAKKYLSLTDAGSTTSGTQDIEKS